MKLYRIVREQFANDLSGRGGLISFARWHYYMPVVYTSLQTSTCILEQLVHIEAGEIHHDLTMVEMSLPDHASYRSVDPDDLPENWKSYPSPPELCRIGNTWLTGRTSLLLYVPGVVDPFSRNVLINPLHEEAAGIRIESITRFVFDRRL